MERLESRQLLAVSATVDGNFVQFESDQDLHLQVVEGTLEYSTNGTDFIQDLDLSTPAIDRYELVPGDVFNTIRVKDTNVGEKIDVFVGASTTDGANLEIGFAQGELDDDGVWQRGKARGPAIAVTDTIDTAGGDLSIGSTQAVVVDSGVLISTRTDKDDPSAGDAGDLFIKATNDDQFNPAFNVDEVSISVRDGAQLLADSTNSGGDLSLIAANVNYSVDVAILNIFAGLSRTAEVNIQNATLRGGNITIDSDAGDINAIDDRLAQIEDNADTAVPEDTISSLAATILGALPPAILSSYSLPLSISVKRATSLIDVVGSAIDSQADVTITSNTKADSFGQASYIAFTKVGISAALTYAEPVSKVTVSDTTINADRDVELSTGAQGVSKPRALVKQNAKKGVKPSTSKEGFGVSVAIGVNLPESKTVFDGDSSIIAGGNVSVTSSGDTNTTTSAKTTSAIDGTAGVTLAFNYTTADIGTTVDGEISATGRAVPAAEKGGLFFDPLAPGVIGFDDGTISFSSNHEFEDGDEVIYDADRGSALEGLTSGHAYRVKVVSEKQIQLTAKDDSGEEQIVRFSDNGSLPTLNFGGDQFPIIAVDADGRLNFPGYEPGIGDGETVTVSSGENRGLFRRQGDNLVRLDGSHSFITVFDADEPEKLALIDGAGDSVQIITDSVLSIGGQDYLVNEYSWNSDEVTIEALDGSETDFAAGVQFTYHAGAIAGFRGLANGGTYFLIPVYGRESTYRFAATAEQAQRANANGHQGRLEALSFLIDEDPDTPEEDLELAAETAFNGAVSDTLVDPNTEQMGQFESVVIDLSEAPTLTGGSAHHLNPTAVPGIRIASTLVGVEAGSSGSSIGGGPTARNVAVTSSESGPSILNSIKGIFSKGTELDARQKVHETIEQGMFEKGRESNFAVAASLLVHYTDNQVQTLVGQNAELNSDESITVDSSVHMSTSGTVNGRLSLAKGKNVTTAVAAGVLVGVYNNDVQTLVERGAVLDAADQIDVTARKEYPTIAPFLNPNAFDARSDNEDNPVEQGTEFIEGAFAVPSKLWNFATQTKANGKSDIGIAISGSIQYTGFAGVTEAIVGWEEEGKDYGDLRTSINQNLPPDVAANAQAFNVDAETLFRTISIVGNFSPGESIGSQVSAVLKSREFKSLLDTKPNEGKKLGIGGSGDILFLDHATRAYVLGPTDLTSDEVAVNASTQTFALRFEQAFAKSGKTGIAGAISVGVGKQETIAILDQSVVVNADSVDINAIDDSIIIGYAGAVAIGEHVGAGITIAVNKFDRVTKAIAGKELGTASAAPVTWTVDRLNVNAVNDGQIVGVTLAAAVVKDDKKPDAPAGGSGSGSGDSGGAAFSLVESFGDLDFDKDGEVDSSSLTDQVTEEDGSSAPKPDDEDGKDFNTNPRNQAKTSPKSEGSGTEGGQGKFGLAISGNVSVNLLNESVEAYIAGPMSITAATEINVFADNATLFISIGGAFAFSLKQDGTNVGIAGAVSYNQLDALTLAGVYDATLSTPVLNVRSKRDGVIGSLTAGAAGASQSKGIAVAGSVSINRMNSNTWAKTENATLNISGSIDVLANDRSQIIAIAGAGAYGGKAGVGAAVSYNELGGQTLASLGSGTNATLSGRTELNVQATNEREKIKKAGAKPQPRIISVTGAVGISKDGAGVAGMVSVNLMNNQVIASIDGATVTHTDPNLTGTSVKLLAQDQSWIIGVGGAVGIGGKAGVGLGIGFNRIRSQTIAEVRDSDLDIGQSLIVDARTDSEIEGVTVGVGGSSKVAVAGSASINLIQNATVARIIETDPSSARSIHVDGPVTVSALDESLVISIAGSGAGSSGGFAAGAAIGYNLIGSQGLDDEPSLMGTQAILDGVDLVSESGDVTVQATSSTLLVGITAGGSGSTGAAIAGSFTVNETKKTILAEIRDAERVLAQSGDIVVDAADRSEMVGFAGAGAGASGVAVGVAISANNVQNKIGARITGNSSGNANPNVIASGDVLIAAGFRDAESLRLPTELDLTEDDEPIKLPSRDDELAVKRKRRDEDGNVIEDEESNTGSIVSVAVSGSGAGTVAINGSVSLNWMRNEVLASISDDANVSAVGVVDVSATDTARLFSIAGGGSGAGTVAIGASIAFNYLGGDPNQPTLQGGNMVRAEIKNATVNADSVDVASSYTGEAFAFSLTGAGSGTVAIVGSINLNFMSSTVEAAITNGAQVTASGSDAEGNGVEVIAHNSGSLIAFGGAGSGSGVLAIAAAVTSNIISSQVTAEIAGAGTSVTTAVGDVLVESGTDAEIINITIGGSGGGTVAIAGSGVGNVVSGNTTARIVGADVRSARDLSVRAVDSSIITSVVGAGAGSGGVSGGVSVDVNLFQSTTVAEIVSATTNATNETLVESLAEQGLVGIAITGAGALFAAIAGAIGVSSVNSTTIARIGDDALVNQNTALASNQQDVIVRAEGKIGGTGKKLLGVNENNIIDTFTTGRGSGAGGIAGVATSIDVVTLRPKALAEIGSDAKVSAKRDIKVTANTEVKASANTFSFAGGIVALNATVGVITVGRGLDAEESKEAIGESNDDGDTAQTVAEKQLRLFDKVLGIESQAASAAGDAFNEDVRSEGAKVLIGDGAVLRAGQDLLIAATTNIDAKMLVGQAQVGVASFGGSVNFMTTGMSATVEIDPSTIDASRNLIVSAYNNATVKGEAFAGALGAVTIAAQTSTIKDSSTELIDVAPGTGLNGSNLLDITAGRNQSLTSEAVGGQAGGIVAGAAVAEVKVTGGTAVRIGDQSILSGQAINIGTDTNIITDAVSRSVATGGITAAASVALSTVEPTITTEIGKQVILSGATSEIITASKINGKSDALGTSIGIAATGPSVSTSSVSPAMRTMIGDNVQFDVHDSLTIDTRLGQFDPLTRTVESKSTAASGGGLAISAGTSDAVLGGSVDTVIGNDVELVATRSSNIKATTSTNTFSQMLAAAGAIIAAGDSDATAVTSIASGIQIGENLAATNVDTLNVIASGNNAVVAFDVSGTGGVISGASARARTINNAQSSVDWNDDTPDATLALTTLFVSANQLATVRSAVDSVNASVGGGVGVSILNQVNVQSNVSLPVGLSVEADSIGVFAKNQVVKELPSILKPRIDKDGDGVFEDDEDTKPIKFDVASGSGGAIDVPSATSQTLVNAIASVDIASKLAALDQLIVLASHDLNLKDRVRLTSAGAGSGVKAESKIVVNPLNEIQVSGDLQSHGSLDLNASTQGQVNSQAIGKSFGLSGVVEGEAIAGVFPINRISLLSGSDVVALGDQPLTLRAGSANQRLGVEALTDLFNGTLIPLKNKPVASSLVTQTNTIEIQTGANVASGKDAFLLAESPRLEMLGQATRATTYSGSSDTNDPDRSFGSRFRDEQSVENNSVIVNGNVRVNQDRRRILDIQPNANTANPFDFVVAENVGEVGFQVASEDTDIRFYVDRLVSLAIANRVTVDAQFSSFAAAEAIERNAEIQRLLGLIQSLTDVSLASEAELQPDHVSSSKTQDVNRLMTLVPETVAQQSIVVDDVTVDLGDIFVSGQLSGNGLLSAPRDAEIRIESDVPANLVTSQLLVPFKEFGRVINNRIELETHPSLRLFESASDRDQPSVSIISDYGSSPAESERIPAINIVGDIDNLFGSLLISNEEGSVEISGGVRAASIEIVSGGDFTLNAPEPIINSAGNPVLESRFGQADPSVVNIGGDAEILLRDYTRRNYEEQQGTTFLDDDYLGITHRLDLPPVNLFVYDVLELPDSATNPLVESGIQAAGNVYITARVINVNGLIQSGDHLRALEIERAMSDRVAELRAQTSPSDPFVEISRTNQTGSITYYTGDIDLFYDPANDRLQVDNVRFKGGYVFLKGQVVSTGDGMISVLDGFGDVTISNASGVELYVPEIDAGEGVRGQIDIVDTDGISGVPVRALTLNDDGTNNPSLVPREAYLVSTYLYDREVSASQTYEGRNVRLRELSSDFDRNDLPNTVNPFGSKTVTDAGPIFADSPGVIDSSFQTSSRLESDGIEYRMVAQPFRYTSIDHALSDITVVPGNFNDRLTRTTTATIQYWVATASKADFPIAIQFAGSTTANIQINGGAAPVTVGTVIARDGAVSISTSGGVNVADFPIRQEDASAIVSADQISLRGSEIVGVDPSATDHLDAGNGFRVDVTNQDSTIEVIASGGDASIVEVNGNLTLQGNFSATDEIDIVVAGGSLLNNLGTNSLAGRTIELSVPSGDIATLGAELRVDAAERFSALAGGNVYLHTPSTLPVEQISSLAGDVSITGAGSVIDANPEEIPDERARATILALYDDARLTGDGAAEVASEVTKDLIAGTRVQYDTYWIMRGRTFNPETGTFAANPFDPDFVYQPNDIELRELAELGQSVEEFVQRRTQQYFDLHAKFGDESYDANFTYTPDQGELAPLLAGNTWTQDQLDNFIDITALAAIGFLPVTDTEIVIESPNIVTDNLTITVGGSVGSTTAPFSYSESSFNNQPIDIQNEILVRLGAASPSDVNDTGDIVEIVRREDVDVVATGLILIDSGGDIYLGSDGNDQTNGDLTLAAIVAQGEVRIKTSGDINANPTGLNIGVYAADGDVLLESSGGQIGSTLEPINVGSVSIVELVARAQENIFLESRVSVHSPLMFTEGTLRVDTSFVDPNSFDDVWFTGDAIADQIIVVSGGKVTALNGGVLKADYIEITADVDIRVDVETEGGTLLADTPDDVVVNALSGDLTLGNVSGKFVSVGSADALIVAPSTTINATGTAGGTLNLAANRIHVPSDAVLNTVDNGTVNISLVENPDSIPELTLLGALNTNSATVIGTSQPDTFTFSSLRDSTIRVFGQAGDDTLNLLATPGIDLNGSGTGAGLLIFNGGEDIDQVNIMSDQDVAADLILDERTVTEERRRLLLGNATEALNIQLQGDVNNNIRVENQWDVQTTTISTANGDDTIHVTCLDESQSMSIHSGLGNDTLTFDQECVHGLIAVGDSLTILENQSVMIPVLENDVNFDFTAGTIEVVLPEADDRVSLEFVDGRPVLRYEPLPGFTGMDSFTYQLRVGDATATGTVSVQVVGVNDAPESLDDFVTVGEDQVVEINPLTNDRDQDGSPLTLVSFGQPSVGTVEEIGEGTLQFTPPANFNGTVNFEYSAQDSGGLADTATVTIVVSPIPDDLRAVDDLVSSDQDTALSVDVLANDIDPDGDASQLQVVTPPSNGTVTPERNDTILYTPADGFSGTDQFSYQIRDSDGNTSVALVTINVVSTVPIAVDDMVTVDEDTAVLIDALANDLNVGNGNEIVELGLDADFGTVTLTSNNQFLYTPDADFFGTDVFAYKVTDAFGNSSTAQATIAVQGVNDAPTAFDDFADVIKNGTAEIDVLENDTDPDGDRLTLTLANDALHGIVTLNGENTFTYVPDAGYAGIDSFTYIVNDAAGETSTATVKVTVTSDGTVENVAPTIRSITTDATLPNMSSNGTVTLSGTFEDLDIDDTHTVVVDWGDGSAPETISHVDFTFDATHNYQTGGLFEISVVVTDANGTSDMAIATAAVSGVGLRDGVLQIIGSPTHDRIAVYPNNGQLRVYFRISGHSPIRVDLPLSEVNSIEAITSSGNDTINISPHLAIPATIESGEGNDWIATGQGNDVIFGGDGRDKIISRGGDDFVDAGSGRDVIFAGGGNNEVFGQGGNDLIFGGAGSDRLFGGDGRDLIKGSGGDDYLDGGQSNDKLFGGDGNDKMVGGIGNDLLLGDDGDDEMDGGEGNDRVFGGRGDDTLFGGSGHDYLNGSNGNDVLRAGDGNDTLMGRNGNDQLFGEAGIDRLFGGDGDDLLDGGLGLDTLRPGRGNDTTYQDSPATGEGELTTGEQQEDSAPRLMARDVNGDGRITAFDALLIINRLALRTAETEASGAFDANQDESVSVIDALIIINHLARSQAGLTYDHFDAVDNASHEEVALAVDDYNGVLNAKVDKIAMAFADEDDNSDQRIDQLLAELDGAI